MAKAAARESYGFEIMASCHRCGKTKLRKRKDGTRSCRHCGIMPGIRRLDRSGKPKPDDRTAT